MRSLEARIVALFVLLLIGMQVGAFLITNLAGTSNTRTRLVDKLTTDRRIHTRLLGLDRSRLAQSARNLAGDSRFRDAVASDDQSTVIRTLTRERTQDEAQLAMVVGLDRRVRVDLHANSLVDQSFPLDGLIDAAGREGEASGIVYFHGGLYQTVVQPIRNPRQIGWLILGYSIDDDDTRLLHDMVGLEVSYLTLGTDGHWRMDTTTLQPTAATGLLARFDNDRPAISEDPISIAIGGDDFLTIVSPLPNYGGPQSVAVIQRSLVDYMKPFRKLQKELIGFALVAMCIAILCCIWIARSIVKPVKTLASFARRLAGGDYSEPLQIERRDEMGDLAAAFDQMREGITFREQKILDLAYRDALTGLPNRTLLNDRLKQAIASSRRVQRPVSMLVIDLDRFKEVNDLLGHRGGDAVLAEVARRLKTSFKRTSDTIARMGADEFAVLMPTEGKDEVLPLVTAFLRALETPFVHDGHTIDIRASIGVAIYPDHGDDFESFARNADSAVQVAKRNKTGYAIFDPQRERLSVERLSLMSELRRAVEQDELVLHFQPKREFVQTSTLSLEVLLRWQHPTKGMVGPDAFIPFAEQTGYISLITEWVLGHALAQCRRWRDEGLETGIAVNISTRDLTAPGFPTLVADLIAKHECRAQDLVLEITETAILSDPGLALQNMERLHALGCKLSIDDFGTGYSSLAYLKRLPVNELKIDKSFVMNMTMDSSDAVIVKSTIDLGHNMGLKVVAEGVETMDVLHQLREMGCDVVQGYLVSRPLDAAALERWARSDRLSLVKPPPTLTSVAA